MSHWHNAGCLMFGHNWRKARTWFGISVVRCTYCGIRLPRRFWGRVGL